jgi:hypothetical protein
MTPSSVAGLSRFSIIVKSAIADRKIFLRWRGAFCSVQIQWRGWNADGYRELHNGASADINV